MWIILGDFIKNFSKNVNDAVTTKQHGGFIKNVFGKVCQEFEHKNGRRRFWRKNVFVRVLG